MSQINRRRPKHMLLSRFQKWFIASSLIYFVTILGLLNFGIYLWYKVTVSQLIGLAGLLSPTLFQNMQHSVHLGLGLLVATNLVLIAVSVVHALYFSRKIAGPIYALFSHLGQVTAARRFFPLKLRKGDLFDDLPAKLEEAFHSVTPNGNDQTSPSPKDSKAA